MAQCEMCAKSLQSSSKVIIEGVIMTVCANCAKFGKPVERPKQNTLLAKTHGKSQKLGNANSFKPRRRAQNADADYVILPNIGQLIKQARETRNMRQIDLSRLLSISESEIHQIEAGSLMPTLAVARKFESGLKLKLITKLSQDDEDEADADIGLVDIDDFDEDAIVSKFKK